MPNVRTAVTVAYNLSCEVGGDVGDGWPDASLTGSANSTGQLQVARAIKEMTGVWV